MDRTMDAKALKGLADAGIISFKGLSGIDVKVEIAIVAPDFVQVYAMSGKVYDLARNGDAFALVPREEASNA